MFKEILEHPLVKLLIETKIENLQKQNELHEKQLALAKLQLHAQKMNNKMMECNLLQANIEIPDDENIIKTVKVSPFSQV